MDGPKNLFCSSNFRVACERISSEFLYDLGRVPQKFDVFLTVHHSLDFSKYQLSTQFF